MSNDSASCSHTVSNRLFPAYVKLSSLLGLRSPGFREARNEKNDGTDHSFQTMNTMRSIRCFSSLLELPELILLIGLFVHTKGLSRTSLVRYQPGQQRHGLQIATTLAKQLMNPLDIQTDRFIVATTDNDELIGWAQLKPTGTLMMQDPARYNSRPGSYDLEREVDDAMWDDFERDNSIQIPTGLASLPWTKEYQQMQNAARGRDKRRERIRAVREKELKSLQLYELSSVYVDPAYRKQGIGSELVRRVLRRRLVEDSSPSLPSCVYLLTLQTTSGWYQRNFGFEIVDADNIPASMSYEVMAGNVITKLIGAELCCMRGTSKTVELCKS